MNNLSPNYLSDLLKLNDRTRSLRSSEQRLLIIPRSTVNFLLLVQNCGIVFLLDMVMILHLIYDLALC